MAAAAPAADATGAPVEGSDVPPFKPTRAFLLIDGALAAQVSSLISEVVERSSLTLLDEYRLALNSYEAKAFLKLATKVAMDAAMAAAAAAAANATPREKDKKGAPAKGAKGAAAAPAPAAAPVTLPPLEPGAFDPVVRQEEINSLSSSRCTVVVLEGLDAVSAVNKVLGSGNPSQWAAPDTDPADIRPRVAEGRAYNILHSAYNQAHADAVLVYLEDVHEQQNALLKDSGPRLARKSPAVEPAHLIDFLFPPGQQHPKTTGRLILFSLYGPLDDSGQLRAGMHGEHIITDRELRVMIDDIETEDVIATFTKDKGLTDEQKLEILDGIEKSLISLPNLSRTQIDALLAPLPRDSSGRLNFHDIQRVVVAARQERMRNLKKMYPDVTGGGGGPVITKAPPEVGRAAKLGRKPVMRMRPRGPGRKIDDNENFLIVAKMLNRDSHHVCDIQDVNNPAITQNVRIIKDTPESKDDGWDDMCCLAGTQRGTFVRTSKRG